ncbi:MAG: hypothetical protein P8179_09635 [Candidatus Thiodiazotropha sp.]
MIEACSGQERRRNAQGMARPFQALQRSILASLPFRIGLVATTLVILLDHIIHLFLTAFIVTMAAT